jgi:hypothetical protein
MISQFSQPQRGSAPAVSAQQRMMRKPLRISATLNWQLHQRLQDRADLEGRSLSNLISYLLELASMG